MYWKFVITGCDHVITRGDYVITRWVPFKVFPTQNILYSSNNSIILYRYLFPCLQSFILNFYLYSSSFHSKSLLKYIIMTKVLQLVFQIKEKRCCSRVMVSCWYVRAEKRWNIYHEHIFGVWLWLFYFSYLKCMVQM